MKNMRHKNLISNFSKKSYEFYITIEIKIKTFPFHIMKFSLQIINLFFEFTSYLQLMKSKSFPPNHRLKYLFHSIAASHPLAKPWYQQETLSQVDQWWKNEGHSPSSIENQQTSLETLLSQNPTQT